MYQPPAGKIEYDLQVLPALLRNTLQGFPLVPELTPGEVEMHGRKAAFLFNNLVRCRVFPEIWIWQSKSESKVVIGWLPLRLALDAAQRALKVCWNFENATFEPETDHSDPQSPPLDVQAMFNTVDFLAWQRRLTPKPGAATKDEDIRITQADALVATLYDVRVRVNKFVSDDENEAAGFFRQMSGKFG